MKKLFSFCLAAIALSTLLLNCECKHICTPASPILNFSGFDSTELNTVVIKQYNNNGQFTDLQHTTVYTSMVFSAAHAPGPDTAHLDGAGIPLDLLNDYVIEVPAAGRTWRFRNMSMQVTKMPETNCTDGIKYYQNDTLHTIPASSTSANSSVPITLSK